MENYETIRNNSNFFLPNILTFTNGNGYLGSFQGLRFRVKPETKEIDGNKAEMLDCLCWYGEYCMQESEIVAQAEFQLTEEGREQVIDWIQLQYNIMISQN